MRRVVAILCFFVYVLGTTEMDQVLRLPLLVKHYLQHKAESPGITMYAFFKMHYIDPQPFDDDYQQDMQLPFKRIDVRCIPQPSILPEIVASVIPRTVFYVPHYILYNEQHMPDWQLNGIFRPPQRLYS